jgi:hypothetical protein
LHTGTVVVGLGSGPRVSGRPNPHMPKVEPDKKKTRIDFIPIPGTKRVKYLEENNKAIDEDLTPEEEAEVRRAIESVGGSKGDRYPAAMMARLFGDSPELPS